MHDHILSVNISYKPLVTSWAMPKWPNYV